MPAVARLGYEACMSNDPERADGADPAPGISRRRLLTSSAASAVLGGVGVGGAALVWPHHHGPAVWYQPDRNGAPPVAGLHLQFGTNAEPGSFNGTVGIGQGSVTPTTAGASIRN